MRHQRARPELADEDGEAQEAGDVGRGFGAVGGGGGGVRVERSMQRHARGALPRAEEKHARAEGGERAVPSGIACE